MQNKYNVFIDFFLPIILFTIDKIKEIVNTEGFIEVVGKDLKKFFMFNIDGNGNLLWFNDF